ncbi:hypothetical protein ASE00_16150 [Sphingomonas sp. Root710]|nr:hypothetical protein ASE00_16150 [Sphingomonas sp. Root710]
MDVSANIDAPIDARTFVNLRLFSLLMKTPFSLYCDLRHGLQRKSWNSDHRLLTDFLALEV